MTASAFFRPSLQTSEWGTLGAQYDRRVLHCRIGSYCPDKEKGEQSEEEQTDHAAHHTDSYLGVPRQTAAAAAAAILRRVDAHERGYARIVCTLLGAAARTTRAGVGERDAHGLAELSGERAVGGRNDRDHRHRSRVERFGGERVREARTRNVTYSYTHKHVHTYTRNNVR